MKWILFVLCLISTPLALADDLDLAKQTFEKFVEYQKTDDLRLLDLLTPSCSGQIVQSDGTVSLTTIVPKERFRQGIEAALRKKEGNNDLCEDVEFKTMTSGVIISGNTRYLKSGFKGPFSMTVVKDQTGAMKVNYVRITILLGKTSIQSHGLYEFVMPGEWEPFDGEKMETGGKLFYPGGARSVDAGLSYFALEYPATKIADVPLENFPNMVAEPLVKKAIQRGGLEEARNFSELTPGNKDQGFYTIQLKSPEGSKAFINGLVLRTNRRVYIIQIFGPSIPSENFWREVAKSFKEL